MFLRAILRPKAAERQAWGSTAVASDTGDHSHRGLLPYVLTDFETTMRFLLKRGKNDGVEIPLQRDWDAMDLLSVAFRRSPAALNRGAQRPVLSDAAG